MLLNLPIRDNLSISGGIPDDELWTALETCGCTDFVAQLPEKLDAVAKTLSRGQVLQLITSSTVC